MNIRYACFGACVLRSLHSICSNFSRRKCFTWKKLGSHLGCKEVVKEAWLMQVQQRSAANILYVKITNFKRRIWGGWGMSLPHLPRLIMTCVDLLQSIPYPSYWNGPVPPLQSPIKILELSIEDINITFLLNRHYPSFFSIFFETRMIYWPRSFQSETPLPWEILTEMNWGYLRHMIQNMPSRCFMTCLCYHCFNRAQTLLTPYWWASGPLKTTT